MTTYTKIRELAEQLSWVERARLIEDLAASLVEAASDDEADAQAAREGLAAYQAGETLPWEDVRQELLTAHAVSH